MSGTGLKPSEIVRICKQAYKRAPVAERLGRMFTGSLFPFLGALLAYLGGEILSLFGVQYVQAAGALLKELFAPALTVFTLFVVFWQCRHNNNDHKIRSWFCLL